MKCQKCGTYIPDDSKFCKNCGQVISSHQSNNLSNEYSPNIPKPQTKTVRSVKNNADNSSSFSAASVKSNNSSTNTRAKPKNKKIIIAIVVAFIVIGFFIKISDPTATTSNKDKSTNHSTKIKATTVLSNEAKASIEASKFEKEHGVPQKLYDSIVTACKEVGINEVDYLKQEKNWANGERFSLSYEGFKFVFYLNKDRTINSINSGDTKFYENGRAVLNVNDHIYTNDQKIQVKIWAEDAVNAQLKSPSTAKFAKSSEWNYSREKDIFTASAYVDAQNGFGAMLRSNFIVKIKWDGKSTQATVLSVDIA